MSKQDLDISVSLILIWCKFIPLDEDNQANKIICV